MKYVKFKVDSIQSLPGVGTTNFVEQNKSFGEGYMNEKLIREERLWDFIDGRLTQTEALAIEKLIATSTEWQNSYQELLECHKLINNTGLEAPSLRFSKNVMEEIAKYQIAKATKTYINRKVIWSIGGFLIIIILGLLIYGMSQITWSGKRSPGFFSNYDFSKFDWSQFFSSTYVNIFLMINVVLGLALLDLYLQRRKRQSKEEA